MSLRVLIVDDNDTKLREIRECVIDSGVSSSDIVSLDNADSVRQYLAKEAVDIFIVDIALPQYEGEAPQSDIGIRLLNQIFRQKKYSKPKYVVGVTAHEEIKGDFDEYFENHLWYLLFRTDTDDSWKDKLYNFLNKVLDANREVESSEDRPDIFVIAAKREVELQALLNLPISWSSNLPLDDLSFYREGELEIQDSKYRICIGSPYKIGLVPATMYAQKVVDILRPKVLTMNGICAGIKSECEIGDVLIAESSWEWQCGKYTSGSSTFSAEPNFVSIDQDVISRYIEIAEDSQFLSGLRERWPAQKPSSVVSLKCGPIATGSSVLADENMVTKIRQTHRKLIGIEMEIYGVYYVAFTASHPKPKFFAIKSVSDFADSDKGNDYQDYCAYLSSNVLLEFLKRNLPSLLS